MSKQTLHFNGPAILAAMFRELDPVFRKQLYGKLQKISPILAKVVDDFEFIYQDFILLDNASLQLLLSRFPESEWLLAWKLTSKSLQVRLLQSMSEARRGDFLQDFDKLPRVPKAQVVRLQLRMAREAHELLKAGKLKIHSKRPLIKLKSKKKSLKKFTPKKSA